MDIFRERTRSRARSFVNYELSSRKASISDVAQMTGLSRSTIDRVLNERPGVKMETRQKVESALKLLGYAPSALCSRRTNKSKTLCLMVPEGTNPFFAKIRDGIEDATRQVSVDYGHVQLLRFDPYEPEQFLTLLDQVADDVDTVITVGVDRPEAEISIRKLQARGVRLITLVSDVPNSSRSAYVGQDNFIVGRTAGRLMIEAMSARKGTIAVVLGHFQFRHHLDRQSGFQQILGLERPDMTLATMKPYGTDPDLAQEIATKVVNDYPDLRGVYLGGGGQPYLIEALSKLANRDVVTIGHELTAPTRAALRDGTMKYVLAHDMYELGRRAVDALYGRGLDTAGKCEVKIYVAENLPFDD